ncbi:MAG TPA: hypothetical protein VK583_11770 [Burkholderiales bacterium]|nr:hypothetical protein [Burkholderiales bacterium]
MEMWLGAHAVAMDVQKVNRLLNEAEQVQKMMKNDEGRQPRAHDAGNEGVHAGDAVAAGHQHSRITPRFAPATGVLELSGFCKVFVSLAADYCCGVRTPR